MPRGRLPTGIVAITVLVLGGITLMVLLTSLLQYSRGSRARRETALARASGSSSEVRYCARIIATSCSVVEDGLIDVEGSVEPANPLASPDVAQDGARQSGPAHRCARRVGAGQTGWAHQGLAA